MITTAFLTEVAEYVNSKITKMVLNSGEYEITEFQVKSVADQVLALNYIVPNGSVEAVNRIELKNQTGTVSDNTVYVPIAADTLMIQTIQVKEGI